MIKTAHESPKSIFSEVQSRTDIDYALVHLFEEDEEYYQLFVDALAKGREVILDNSIFELEEAFDADKFAYWVEKLKPTWYIIPDALEDKDKTKKQLDNWLSNFSHLEGKSIGVVQGKSYEEVVECYQYVAPRVDMVAISFDYSFFEEWYPEEKTKYHKWVKGRQHLLDKLMAEGVWDKDKPHHLLGCGLPQEFAYYRHREGLYSLDTSNPVVHGICDTQYELQGYGLYGLEDKESVKLFTMINQEVSEEQLEKVIYNIDKFKENLSK